MAEYEKVFCKIALKPANRSISIEDLDFSPFFGQLDVIWIWLVHFRFEQQNEHTQKKSV